jgi:hypothetical protein
MQSVRFECVCVCVCVCVKINYRSTLDLTVCPSYEWKLEPLLKECDSSLAINYATDATDREALPKVVNYSYRNNPYSKYRMMMIIIVAISGKLAS